MKRILFIFTAISFSSMAAFADYVSIKDLPVGTVILLNESATVSAGKGELNMGQCSLKFAPETVERTISGLIKMTTTNLPKMVCPNEPDEVCEEAYTGELVSNLIPVKTVLNGKPVSITGLECAEYLNQEDTPFVESVDELNQFVLTQRGTLILPKPVAF